MAHPIFSNAGAIEIERRNWLTQGLALASVCLLPALSACESPPEMDKLTIGHAYHASFGLLYVADQAGLFKSEGLDVQFKHFSSGRDALKATLEGGADIATPFDTPVAMAIVNDNPVRVLSSLSVLQGNAQVMGNKRRGILRPEDLKDRHIGLIPNTNAEYLLSMVHSNAGIDEQEVVLVPFKGPDELSQAMIRGDVDAAALWAPFTHLISTEMSSEAVVGFTSSIYVETALLTTTTEALKKNKRAIKKLMTALVKAQNLSIQEPDRALRYIQKSLPDTPADVVARTWASVQPQVRLNRNLQVSLENQLTWLQKKLHLDLGYVPDVRLWLASEILRAVQPQAVTLSQPH